MNVTDIHALQEFRHLFVFDAAPASVSFRRFEKGFLLDTHAPLGLHD